MQQAKRAFTAQRLWAAKRGIEFLLTFDQWLLWWEQQLGPDWLLLRGVGHGKFCMARPGDKGPYALGNIECKLHVENHREGNFGKQRNLGYQHTEEAKRRIGLAAKGNRYGQCKLTDADVIRIRRAKGAHRVIAKRFGVSQGYISMIKTGKRCQCVI
jgi:hypothetical protein